MVASIKAWLKDEQFFPCDSHPKYLELCKLRLQKQFLGDLLKEKTVETEISGENFPQLITYIKLGMLPSSHCHRPPLSKPGLMQDEIQEAQSGTGTET